MKKILIFGATSALASSIIFGLDLKAIDLYLASRNIDELENKFKGIFKKTYKFQLENEESIKDAIQDSCPDVIIDTSGVNRMQHTHLEDSDDFLNVIKLNLLGPFYILKHGCAYFLSKGEGQIILTSSISAKSALPWSAAYSASKSGLIQMAKSIAYEYSKSSIRINVIAPSGFDSPMVQNIKVPDSVDYSLIEKFIPPKGLSDPNDVCKIYHYLIDFPESSPSGTVYYLDNNFLL